jgi:hypothetical protein
MRIGFRIAVVALTLAILPATSRTRSIRAFVEPIAPVRAWRGIADADAVQRAYGAFRDKFARARKFFEIAMHEADLQVDLRRRRACNDAPTCSDIARHWLLQQQRLARSGNLRRQIFVRVVGRCHDHRIDIRTREDGRQIGA